MSGARAAKHSTAGERGGADLCFVSAEGGSAFMAELLDVVADAVTTAGGRARTAVGGYPEPAQDTVYVVVPHEYFVVTPDADLPDRELLARTIGFCVEHPGTRTFERNAALTATLGGAVDINLDSAAELRRRGVAVEHFQLGYSPLWDMWGGDQDSVRDIDVTYLGTAERRRSLLLGSYSADLDDLRVRLLTPPHEMMHGSRVDFMLGKAKLAHLARSRFLINLHREQKSALEWVRTLEAICNGCVVVSEPSTEVAPMVAGEHLLIARPESIGAAVAALAGQPERERWLRASAYEFARGLDMRPSARTLIELAGTLAFRGGPAPSAESMRDLAATMRSPQNAVAIDTPSWDPRFAGDRSLQGAPPRGAAGVIQRVVTARRVAEPRWVRRTVQTPPGADVDVILVRRPGEADPAGLVSDLLTGTTPPNRIMVGEDGVQPRPGPTTFDLLVHDQPLGRALTRNDLLARSSAHWLLVLDGGMRASRHLLTRLLAAANDGADVVHCPVADPIEGLVGALPVERRRLATIPYLGSGYLVRRELVEELGGWVEDPLLEGLEDHVFWRRIAATDRPTTLVQQVLLSRTTADPPPRPLDLSPARVWAQANAYELP